MSSDPRRDMLAGFAMAGLLADHKDHSDECADGETCINTVARLAQEHADALIERLDKTANEKANHPAVNMAYLPPNPEPIGQDRLRR